MARTHQVLMASTGITGKDITTPPRGLRWKSDQWISIGAFFIVSPLWTIINILETEKKMTGWLKITEKKHILSLFLLIQFWCIKSAILTTKVFSQPHPNVWAGIFRLSLGRRKATESAKSYKLSSGYLTGSIFWLAHYGFTSAQTARCKS